MIQAPELTGVMISNPFWLTDEDMPPKTLYNRWRRWGDLGVFARMMEGLATEGGEVRVVMIDATYLKAHRMALTLRVEREGTMTSAGA